MDRRVNGNIFSIRKGIKMKSVHSLLSFVFLFAFAFGEIDLQQTKLNQFTEKIKNIFKLSNGVEQSTNEYLLVFGKEIKFCDKDFNVLSTREFTYNISVKSSRQNNYFIIKEYVRKATREVAGKEIWTVLDLNNNVYGTKEERKIWDSIKITHTIISDNSSMIYRFTPGTGILRIYNNKFEQINQKQLFDDSSYINGRYGKFDITNDGEKLVIISNKQPFWGGPANYTRTAIRGRDKGIPRAISRELQSGEPVVYLLDSKGSEIKSISIDNWNAGNVSITEDGEYIIASGSSISNYLNKNKINTYIFDSDLILKYVYNDYYDKYENSDSSVLLSMKDDDIYKLVSIDKKNWTSNWELAFNKKIHAISRNELNNYLIITGNLSKYSLSNTTLTYISDTGIKNYIYKINKPINKHYNMLVSNLFVSSDNEIFTLILSGGE